MATKDRSRDDLISELINMLAGPVSTGVKAVGQANQRRVEAMDHLEQLCAELRRIADVGRRMVDLLDEVEAPLRAAAPQIGRLAQIVGDALDEAPDDLGKRVANLVTSLEKLGDGLGPLLMLAQGAAGMFGGARPPAPASSPAAATPAATTTRSQSETPAARAAKKAPAKKTPATKAPSENAPAKKTAAKKTAAKKTAAKKSPAKKAAAARRR